jgi:hypothetical protein
LGEEADDNSAEKRLSSADIISVPMPRVLQWLPPVLSAAAAAAAASAIN